MTNLDLNLLPIAVAIYDELSVSRAAQRLGMSQPGVSRALRRLREAFDDPLFVRGATGITPTPRAHALVRAARSHIEYLHDDLLKDEAFDPAASTRPMTLAISDVAELAFFPAVIEHFRRLLPKCAIRTASAAGSELADGLETGKIDVAAGYFPSLSARSFRQRRVSKHGFACLVRAGHPLWQRRLSVSAYLAAKHIVIKHEGRSLEVLERFIARRRLSREVAVVASHVLSVPFIVMESDLMATLPYAVVTRFASLTSRVAASLPPFDISYDLKIHWHRRFDNDPRNSWLRDQLFTVLKEHQWLQPPPGPAPFIEP
ncbi:MAG TPA: LysR family transcriptional regulator [Planctomycetaceae bacterium]|nr:LysR family transcriptional regulator [Planctomycetaceae bacterium]